MKNKMLSLLLSLLLLLSLGLTLPTTMLGQNSGELVLTIYSVPIATTVPITQTEGWETGLTIVNVDAANTIVINRVEYIDAKDSALNLGFGFNQVVNPGRRWSTLLSQVLGKGKDGQLQIHILAVRGAKVTVFAASWVEPENFNFIPVRELTSHTIR